MIWKEIKIIESSDKNVLKYVFEKDNAVAESVLYKYPSYDKRTVVCCSTQSGCPIGCRFCGAGDNFVRSLTAEEIVSQPIHLFESKNIDAINVNKLQIMMMSMGEPLLNIKNVSKAIRELNKLYPNAALLISTSAPKVNYDNLIKLSVDIDKVGLQFSIHESTDENRNKLIPFENKLPLKEIAIEGERWFKATKRKPFFNYCAHENNSSIEDSNRLLELFNPEIWEATISVICERDEHVSAANERQRQLAVDFRYLLGKNGFNTRIFDPAGQDDCGGGCGQLWYVQDWMNKNKNLVKSSTGKHLPIFHAPS